MIGGRKIEDYTKKLYNRLENEKNTLTKKKNYNQIGRQIP